MTTGKGWHNDHIRHVDAGKEGAETKKKNKRIEELSVMSAVPNRRINMSKKHRVFLGGTCNGSTWRDELIPLLEIDYFNPVVEDWTPDCMKEELKQRKECDYCLYTITPEMTGVYSIAEVIDDSNKRPEKTIFCVMNQGNEKRFDEGNMRSLTAVGEMVERNGGKFVINDLTIVADILNGNDKTINGYWGGADCGHKEQA